MASCWLLARSWLGGINQPARRTDGAVFHHAALHVDHVALVGHATRGEGALGALVVVKAQADLSTLAGTYVVTTGEKKGVVSTFTAGDASIDIDANGALSVSGRPLLGEGGAIVLPPHSAVEVGTDGTVSVMAEGATTMQVIDKLRLVNAEGPELTKNEAGLIVARNGNPLEADANITVRARALEGSNVSAVEEMVATMALNRSFELQMKLFQAGDKMNEAGNRLLGA